MRAICFILLLVSSALSCPSDYTVDPSGDCYKLYGGNALSRFQALRQCQKDGATLYAPINQAENNRLVGYAAQIGAIAWIGVTCVDTSTTSCINDEGIPNPYSNFVGPVNGVNGGACAALQTFNGIWYSQECAAYVAHFVCRYTGHIYVQTCEPGSWLFNNHCYSLRSPNDALITEESCGNYDGHLASVHTVGENNFLFSMTYNSFDQAQFSRIGLYNSYSTVFQWSDGTSYDYSNWGLKIPNSQCTDISMQSVGAPRTKWVSADCGQPTSGSICKKAAISVGPPVTHTSTLCSTGGMMSPNGTFWSPNYPLPYADENCNNVIIWENTFGNYLHIQFPEIYLGENDIINVYNNVISSNPQVTITYSSDPFQILTFTTGSAKIEFIGNNNQKNNYRWRGLLSISPIKPNIAFPSGMNYCSKNNTQINGYGQFRTLNYGSGSVNYLDGCQITLRSKSSQSTVAVTFYDFYMGPGDVVTFYDGFPTSGNKLVVVSGAQPGLAVESTGPYMTIVVSKKSQGYRGFWGDFYSN